MHRWIPFSQMCPVNPGEQLHVGPDEWTVLHLPPFRQGLLGHVISKIDSFPKGH